MGERPNRPAPLVLHQISKAGPGQGGSWTAPGEGRQGPPAYLYLVKKKLERSLGNCALPSPTLIETSLAYPNGKLGATRHWHQDCHFTWPGALRRDRSKISSDPVVKFFQVPLWSPSELQGKRQRHKRLQPRHERETVSPCLEREANSRNLVRGRGDAGTPPILLRKIMGYGMWPQLYGSFGCSCDLSCTPAAHFNAALRNPAPHEPARIKSLWCQCRHLFVGS